MNGMISSRPLSFRAIKIRCAYILYELRVEVAIVEKIAAYPGTSIADVKVISAALCWELGSGFSGNSVMEDGGRALKVARLIGKALPVTGNIAVRLCQT